jgi:hypothetical protein
MILKTVDPRQLRRLDLVLEDGDLVAQDEDLGILGALGPGEQGEPAEHAQHRKIGESHRHEYRQCPTMRPSRSRMPNLTFPRAAQDTRSATVTGFPAPTAPPWLE